MSFHQRLNVSKIVFLLMDVSLQWNSMFPLDSVIMHM
uniref:Uncharacterized protein n=1 Tax=Arundo donax TaxID=35708 RepID=A0A0A9GQ68_ARUDO